MAHRGGREHERRFFDYVSGASIPHVGTCAAVDGRLAILRLAPYFRVEFFQDVAKLKCGTLKLATFGSNKYGRRNRIFNQCLIDSGYHFAAIRLGRSLATSGDSNYKDEQDHSSRTI